MWAIFPAAGPVRIVAPITLFLITLTRNLYSLCYSGWDKESHKKQFNTIGLIVLVIFGNNQALSLYIIVR